MSTCVLTFFGNYPDWQTALVVSNRREYCSLHGYVCMLDVSTTETALPHSRKIRMSLAGLSQCQWMLWLDADVFILDTRRPLQRFIDKIDGYDILLPGETMTKYAPRYQFSNFAFLIRRSNVTREFLMDWQTNMLYTEASCPGNHVFDQLSMRSALGNVASRLNGMPVPCEHSCNLRCLDRAMFHIHNQQLRKGALSVPPLYFTEISETDTGLALQCKQETYQWGGNRGDSRHLWLPPLQRAILNSFAVHWNMLNSFDFDWYIAFFYRHHSEYNASHIPVYPYPAGCREGDGQTAACCAMFKDKPRQYRGCVDYGKRMGDTPKRTKDRNLPHMFKRHGNGHRRSH